MTTFKKIVGDAHSRAEKLLNVRTIMWAGIGVFFASVSCVQAQDGAALFKQTCSACHTVGGGRLVGPDLKGVTQKRKPEWLMKWTKSSQSLISSGDVDAKAIFEEYKVPMPDQNLADADIKAIYTYIESQSGGGTAEAAAPAATAPAQPAKSSDNATEKQIQLGQNLFEGSVRFTNGGPSCLSCHNVNYKGVIPGGLLAKDLTTVYGRLGGDAGLQGILGAPPFPAMTQAYKNKNLTDREIFALTAFFNKINKDTANQTAVAGNPFLYAGPIGLAIILILIAALWYRRKKYTVKKDIYDRQLKSI